MQDAQVPEKKGEDRRRQARGRDLGHQALLLQGQERHLQHGRRRRLFFLSTAAASRAPRRSAKRSTRTRRSSPRSSSRTGRSPSASTTRPGSRTRAASSRTSTTATTRAPTSTTASRSSAGTRLARRPTGSSRTPGTPSGARTATSAWPWARTCAASPTSPCSRPSRRTSFSFFNPTLIPQRLLLRDSPQKAPGAPGVCAECIGCFLRRRPGARRSGGASLGFPGSTRRRWPRRRTRWARSSTPSWRRR